jgi:hypothetical protein
LPGYAGNFVPFLDTQDFCHSPFFFVPRHLSTLQSLQSQHVSRFCLPDTVPYWKRAMEALGQP